MCANCGAQERTRGNLRKHLANVHKVEDSSASEEMIGLKSFQCDICSEVIFKRSDFDQHLERHVRQEGYTPTGKKRQNKAPLQRHR